MEAVIGLGVLAAAFAVLYMVQTVIGKTTNAVDRKVRAGTYRRGREQTRTALRITAPVSAKELLDTIVSKVNAHPSAPAVVPGLFVKGRTADSVVFAVGNKLQESMTAVVECESDGGGTAGTFAVHEWLESGASVGGAEELAKMRTRITEAVRQCGGSVEQFMLPPPS